MCLVQSISEYSILRLVVRSIIWTSVLYPIYSQQVQAIMHCRALCQSSKAAQSAFENKVNDAQAANRETEPPSHTKSSNGPLRQDPMDIGIARVLPTDCIAPFDICNCDCKQSSSRWSTEQVVCLLSRVATGTWSHPQHDVPRFAPEAGKRFSQLKMVAADRSRGVIIQRGRRTTQAL